MEERITVRVYDKKLMDRLDKIYSKSRTLYKSKNPFIVDCINRGADLVEQDLFGVTNVESLGQLYGEIHQTVEKLNKLIKLSEQSSKETMANLTVNQKLLATNYNMLLGLSEDVPKRKDYVEMGMYEDLPEHLEEILQELLTAISSKK